MTGTTLVATALAAASFLGATKAQGASWTEEDQAARTIFPAHHWGQKGEPTPNNGWSSYGSLLVERPGRSLLLRQSRGELSFVLQTNAVTVEGLSILGIIFLCRSPQSTACNPMDLQTVGLIAEQTLHALSQTFPQGPGSVSSASTATWKHPGATEHRFLLATARWKSDREISVSTSPVEGQTGAVKYEILGGERLSGSGQWTPASAEPVIADAEPIDGWQLFPWSSPTFMQRGLERWRDEARREHKTFGGLRSLAPTIPIETARSVRGGYLGVLEMKEVCGREYAEGNERLDAAMAKWQSRNGVLYTALDQLLDLFVRKVDAGKSYDELWAKQRANNEAIRESLRKKYGAKIMENPKKRCELVISEAEAGNLDLLRLKLPEELTPLRSAAFRPEACAPVGVFSER